MKPKTALLIAAVACLVFGVLLLFAPGQTLGNFGVEAHQDGLMLGRDLGVTFLAFALLNWLARDLRGPGLVAILITNIVLQVGEFLLNLVEVLVGAAPAAVMPGEVLRLVVASLLGLALRGVMKDGSGRV